MVNSEKISNWWVLELYEFYKPCELFCLKPSIFCEICTQKKNWGDAPLRKCHRFLYIAYFSDHSLLTLKLSFKVILRRFEVVLWCLEWEYCTFQKTGWKYIQIHQYYIEYVVLCQSRIAIFHNVTKIIKFGGEYFSFWQIWILQILGSFVQIDIQFALLECHCNGKIPPKQNVSLES